VTVKFAIDVRHGLEPGLLQWAPARRQLRATAILRCPGCGDLIYLGADHRVRRRTGVVRPDVACDSCPWRATVVLEGWSSPAARGPRVVEIERRSHRRRLLRRLARRGILPLRLPRRARALARRIARSLRRRRS